MPEDPASLFNPAPRLDSAHACSLAEFRARGFGGRRPADDRDFLPTVLTDLMRDIGIPNGLAAVGYSETAFAAPLPDGRWAVARVPRFRRPPGLGWGLPLVALAVAVAIGAYPVVRRITRRLEQLQRGVDALGAGNVMFSADYPFERTAEASHFIETVDIDEALRQQICWDNAKRILNLKV